MDEEILNIQIRKFLKKVGITSQREIEKSVRQKLEEGSLKKSEILHPVVTLSVPELDLNINISDDISLE
ncbi:DUF6494 family protein [Pseudomonadota bacterium]